MLEGCNRHNPKHCILLYQGHNIHNSKTDKVLELLNPHNHNTHLEPLSHQSRILDQDRMLLLFQVKFQEIHPCDFLRKCNGLILTTTIPIPPIMIRTSATLKMPVRSDPMPIFMKSTT